MPEIRKIIVRDRPADFASGRSAEVDVEFVEEKEASEGQEEKLGESEASGNEDEG